MPARKMPRQKPGRSAQDYGTPREFLDAVERRFGRIIHDLAAHHKNAVCSTWFGPGSQVPDSLSVPWRRERIARDGLFWLNPPFARIDPWAAKCAEESSHGLRIAFLVPASVGSNWYAEHVAPHAYVFALRPRLVFTPETTPYPKDLVLALYEPSRYRGFETWRWT